MNNAAKRTSAEFTPVLKPLLNDLTEELSTGENPVVERICAAVLEELNRLCEFARQVGVDHVREAPGLRAAWSAINSGPFAGQYLGVNIGEHGLGLGFLEEPVAKALKRKFREQSVARYENEKPWNVETMTGTVCIDDWLFSTQAGTFKMTHTYAWFIEQRVD